MGHTHPTLVGAVRDQVGNLVHVSNLFYTEQQIDLAEQLSQCFGGGKCFFANSGAEANEGAVKLARRYSQDKGEQGRTDIVTAFNSFHGRTLAMVAATGQPDKRRRFGPLLGGFTHVKLNDTAELESAINGRTCAVMLEPIQGEGGVNPVTARYLETARRLCDERDVLLILDEVQTGVGRTGRFFAFDHFGVRPDIVVLAKGLGGGVPIGAFIASDRVSGAFAPGDHGSTFGGNCLASAAALSVLEVLESESLVENARDQGERLRNKLNGLSDRSRLIEEVRGLGLMVGIELRKPVAPEVVSHALGAGLVINAIGDTILRLLPPLI
ncbi:MAG: aspartate aminotransferase family protein, partial [Terriglobia bacterium]